MTSSVEDGLGHAIDKLSRAKTLEQVMRIVRQSARQLTGADGTTFVLLDGDRCFYADEDAIAPLWKGKRFVADSCISGWVMRNRQSAVITDVFADPRISAPLYRPTFVKSMAMVPVRYTDPIAAIGAYWARTHEATETETRILQVLADASALALSRTGFAGAGMGRS